MFICLSYAFFLMAVTASKQSFFKFDSSFINSCIERIEMAKLAIGLGFFQLGRIARLNRMRAFIVNLNDLFMRKILVGKRRLEVTLIGAVDLLCYRIMGKFGNIGMAVSARNIMMDTFSIDMFTDIKIYFFSVFINSAHKTIFVAHETVFLVRCFSTETNS